MSKRSAILQLRTNKFIFVKAIFKIKNMKKFNFLILPFEMITSLIIGILLICGVVAMVTNTKNELPDKFVADKEFFGDSLKKFSEVNDITNRQDENASQEEIKKVVSLTLDSIESSKKVSDEFLEYLHPDLKNNYREKFEKSQQLYYEGLSQANDGDNMDSENIKKQIEAGKLMNEWLVWWRANNKVIISKAFSEN